MATVLYFDPFNGISGDMILGALLDLGLPLEHLRAELGKLPLEHFHLKAERIERQGLFGVDFRVDANAPGGDRAAGPPPSHAHEPEQHGHCHHHASSRGFREIRDMIDGADLDPWVKSTSAAIFRRLGEAEAKVHNATLESVHFHEVGALDSIVDIVGACIGFRHFEAEAFYSAPVNLGAGTVTFSHGTWPVPAPATAELMAELPCYPGAAVGELTTPTGAAILAELVRPGERPPVLSGLRSGFGAGDKSFPEIPNMLRILLGETDVSGRQDEIAVLQANLDDMDPQSCGYFLDLALGKGALDVSFTPIHMKKNRPGWILTLLCTPADRERFCRLLFEHTTTLGVRWDTMRREVLERQERTVQTEWGPVRVKVGLLEGRVVNAVPEFDDLAHVARSAGIPLKRLRRAVEERIQRTFDRD